ncbi:prephenate dehydrogenase [Robiginitalea sp. M366]|uniref:prephenate dehydrogenase n=1 Tax=Robiginitalea aestuariiviva TaxID=3036903 RepID=UPI00240D862D|nr:prephenate dehydrogenase [Robiginitalea aestuariiviva]MDG1570900.1 prephenate dehydrogenase [Robiginitalea aestuariiviva]
MNAVILGIGLIGGSLARDIRMAVPGARILGQDRNPDHLAKAIALKLVDGEAGAEDLQAADLVVVSIPVNHITETLPGLLDAVGEHTLVVDAGSTKVPICRAVAGHPKRRNFLACHPIAGTEFTGPEAAVSGLFHGKVNIICEVEQTAFQIQERALELFGKIGMRIRYMNPEAHDRHIAYVSHLSHISSFMLGKTVIEKEKNERDIFDMAGSGFESTVRLAKSSPAMWTPIFEQNKENVLETLDEYIANLRDFRDKLAADQYEALYREMDHTNRIRDILKGIPLNNKAD